MKKFKFKLQTVLNHRATLEDQAMKAFAAAQGELADCERRIVAAQEQFLRVAQDRPAVDATNGVAQIEVRERHLDQLRLLKEREISLRAQLAARVEEARLALVTARQQRETVQRLREKSLEEYRQEAEKADQEAVDEMATLRFKSS